MCEQCRGPAAGDGDHGGDRVAGTFEPPAVGEALAVDRRGFLAVAGLSLLAGCHSGGTARSLPAPPWDLAAASGSGPSSSSRTPDTVPLEPPPTGGWARIDGVRPRSQWGARPPVPADLNAMSRRIHSITVHHDAIAFDGAAEQDTVARLRSVQRTHIDVRGWADIGYHFAVDRSGRSWEGRELRYQGAHVENHNPGNAGIVLLGNFEVQSPSRAQLEELARLVRALRGRLGVAANRVYTHREWPGAQTECPGMTLQSWMDRARRSAML